MNEETFYKPQWSPKRKSLGILQGVGDSRKIRQPQWSPKRKSLGMIIKANIKERFEVPQWSPKRKSLGIRHAMCLQEWPHHLNEVLSVKA